MSFSRPGTAPPEQPPTPGWGQSLARGAAGLALLHVGYAHAGLGDWATAHRWVEAMTSEPVTAHPDACLYRGAPAVAFVLRAADRPAYADALRTLDEHVVEVTRTRLQAAHQRIDRGELPALREFDLIHGLTGLGVCLLHAVRADPGHPGGEVLREVLAYLVRLTDPVALDGARLPGWWTPNGPSDQPDPAWPGGHANLGMAHGITGPLALLSVAVLGGVTVPAQADAIEHLDRFLRSQRRGPVNNPWWPGTITTRDSAQPADQSGPQRPSWCYGTPGLVRARHLAAQALAAPDRAAEARAAFLACITDDAQLAQFGDDSLCHGWAGLVHTARRMLTDTEPDSALAEAVSQLERRWRSRRDHSAPKPSYPSGMLEGDTGIALIDLPPSTRWDTCLLTTPPTTQPTTTAPPPVQPPQALVAAAPHTEGTG